MTKKKIDALEELSYEQAFEALETVVAALESGQQSLEDSLALFERGQALARRCAALLDQAELRVRALTEIEPAADPMPGDNED